MTPASVTPQATGQNQLVLPVIGLLWLQLFVALMPEWRTSEYYEYGWLVPPLAAFFVLRRRSMGLFERPGADTGRGMSGFVWIIIIIAGFLLLTALRIVQLANDGWRPPLLVHAGLVVAVSHWILGLSQGWRASLALMPVTIFALSAVPYPGRIEIWLIANLTDTVIGVTAEVFHLSGLPVVQLGETLALDGDVVSVTEGCSGIRSMQSMVMAGLFFGEFFLLSWRGRALLVAISSACAIILNVGRAYWLARVHFADGPAAAARIHDLAGHLAFAICALILLGTAAIARRPRSAGTVVTIHGAGS